MRNIIYGLVDPRTLLVRYVGLSSTGEKRPQAHRRYALHENTRKANWIRALLALGLTYEIAVLEEVASKEALADTERFWIAYGRACGWPLTNLTDGGDGALNPAPETRAKRSASLKGRYMSPEHRARIGAAHRGREKSPQERLNIAAALRGKKRSRKSVEKQLASRRGYRHSPETIAKIRASNLGQKRPPSVGIAVAESNRRRKKEWLK